MSEFKANYDIAIIGAGAAGLYTASRLSSTGLHVVVLEARNRIGGRISTHWCADIGVNVECGAEFIHGSPEITPLLLKEARMATLTAEGEEYEATEKGMEPSKNWEEISQVFKRLSENTEDISFSAFLEKFCSSIPQETQDRARMFIEGFNAAPADEISALVLAKEFASSEHESPDRRIEGGYLNLIDHLVRTIVANKGSIFLNHRVTNVGWDRNEATITSDTSDDIHARKLIITIPPPLIADPSFIAFTPDIPEHRRAAAEIGYGHVIKIHALFTEAWWQRDERLRNASFFQTPEQPIRVWWTQYPLSTPLLTGWVGGPEASVMAHQSQGIIEGKALQSLEFIFGDSFKEYLIKIAVTNWQTDLFSRGAYSFQKAGCSRARQDLGRSLSNTIFFAGEATDTVALSGTVESALSSGERVAREILEEKDNIAVLN